MLNEIKRITTDNGASGIELYFDGKPNASIIERLKAVFFRWHSVKKCWYAKANEKTEALAQELGGEITTNEDAGNAETVGASLWERCDVSTIPEHNRHADTKTICAECRAHLKKRFPELKFSIRKTGYSSIDADIIAGPYKREKVFVDLWGNPDPWGRWENSAELDAVLNYCEAFLQSYNYDNSDAQTDYFDVNFYGRFGVSSNYEQTEQTAAILADCADFAEKKAAFEIAEQERRDAEWKAQEEQARKDREEAAAREIVINAQISEIESHVKTVDLPESESFAVLGLVHDSGKSATIEEVERNDDENALKGSRQFTDAIITRKIEFSDARIFHNFCHLFLHDFSFLREFGGWAVEDARIPDHATLRRLNKAQRETIKTFSVKCVAVYLNGVFQFAIDPEGYSYARYILFPVGIFDEETETVPALEYLSERRKETENLPAFYFPETIEKQIEASGLKAGDDVTMIKVDDWICMAQETRGRLADIELRPYAQYNDAAKVYIIPEGKRGRLATEYIHAGQAVVIFKGILPKIPETLLHTDVMKTDGAEMKLVNYAGSGASEYVVKVINYYKSLGYSPVLDLIQR